MAYQEWWDAQERMYIAFEAEETFGVPICGISSFMLTCLSCPQCFNCWPEERV